MSSKSDENTTEELCDEALNVENAVATHLEDQPTSTTHLSSNSDLKSISDDIAMQSIEEHSDNNIISIQNKECDNATKGGVESHDINTTEKTESDQRPGSKSDIIIDTLIEPSSEFINNKISNTIEVTEGKDDTAIEKQVLDDKTSQQEQDDIAMQLIEEHSDNNIISIQNKECDNATKGGAKSHDTNTTEKTESDQRPGSKSDIILDTLIEPSFDSINNKISNTIKVIEGKDDTAIEKQVLDDKTPQQEQGDIAMQSIEHSDNNIISIQNKEYDNATKGGVESHDTNTTEKTESDQKLGSKSDIILDTLIEPSSDSINNKISNTLEVTEGKDDTAIEKQVLDDKTSQQEQDDIAMQSIEEHCDNNIISIQNKECDNATKGGVESHDINTTEKTESDQRPGSKSDIILDTLIEPSSDFMSNKISNTIEVTEGKDETATEKQVLDDKTSQQEQDDIAMQLIEEHSDNNIISIQNKEYDNATKGGVESHDTNTTEKTESDQKLGSKSDIILDTLIEPSSDSINNKISNTLEVTEGKDDTAIEKQVLDDKTSQQEQDDIAMQSIEEHSDNNIISIQNKECDNATKGGVESHDTNTTEKTESDQRPGSKSDIILDTLIEPSSDFISNKISNTIEVTEGKDDTAIEKQVLDDKTSQQEQDDIAMQLIEEHSDNNIISIQNKEYDNATKGSVESHDTNTTEKTESDQRPGSKSDIILDTLIEPYFDSINNKISNTIEVTVGKDETATEKHVLDDKTSQQEQGDVCNEMDVDVLPNTKQEQIIVCKADDDSVKVTDGPDKKPESGTELKMDDYDDSDNMTKPSSDTEKDKVDILVDSKPETSSTKTPGVDLESSLQYDYNGDDKFKLVWEDDDDDDASPNISETIQKIDSMEVSEHDNTNAQEKIDKSPLDTSSSSFLPTKAHGLNKPDVMLEIPTQDFDEFSDDSDDFGQEQIASLVMSPDVETGSLEEKDKSSRQSAEKESDKSISMEIDKIDDSQNICSTSEGTNEPSEISSNNQLEQQNQLNTSYVEVNDEPIPGENSSPFCDIQSEKNNKYENDSSVILKDTEEKQPGIQEETDSNQDLSESRCDDIAEKEPHQSVSNSSEDHTLDDMHQNPDVEEMSDSLGLLAESSRVMDDDEQEEEQDDDGDGDEDDDSDVDDDNSNQMTAENSEDSNAQNTEVDSKEAKDDTPTTSDKEASEDGMNFPNAEPDPVDINVDEIVVEETNIGDIQVEETDITTVDEVQNAEEHTDNNEQDTVTGPTEAIEESVDVPMDIETVKLSDTSDTEMDNDKDDTSVVEIDTNETVADDNEVVVTNENMVDRIVRTEINKNVLDCVYLEATSSDEEVCEVDQESESTTVKMPADIDVISSSGGATSEIVMKETETVISGLPKPPRLKPARINTSEVSIKTTHSKKETITPRELQESSGQVVNLDSDDEEKEKPTVTDSLEEEKTVGGIRCVNRKCPHYPSAQYSIADSRVIAFFEGDKKKRSYVCEDCYDIIHQKNRELITGIQEFKPLMEFDFGNYHEELVEISDSESEEETEPIKDGGDLIGGKTAKFLEDNLTDLFNEVWSKYRMDERLDDTAAEMQEELKRLQKESLEIDELFKQCQIANDKLRTELYASFETDIHELPPIHIDDVGDKTVITPEKDVKPAPAQEMPSKRPRRSTVQGWWEPPSKKKAIPMGYTPLSTTDAEAGKVDDDNTDISVVKLSLESAPADLPPSGPLTRAPLRPGMAVYAKKTASWLRAVISEILPTKNSDQFTMCRVRFEHKSAASPHSTISGRHLAYSTPADTRMIIGTRVIALFKDTGIKEYYSAGIVAEVPNPVNNYRYLIFFDDGYAQYVAHRETRVVCQSSPLVWEEVHVDSRQFVKDYITSYPERPMVRLHAGQNLKTEFKGKWLNCVVEAVDASLVRVAFADGRREWIYRGSTRLAPLFLELQAAERSRPRAAPRAMPRPLANQGNMPYVEYTRSNEQAKSAQNAEEIRRQRSVAKKSTTTSQPTPPAPATNLDDVTSRVVFYTPKNAVKPHKMVPHKCGPQCKRTDVLQLKDLRTYNPLAKPLLSGWERQTVRWRGHKQVMYVGGCGRRLRNMAELHRYLRATCSDMSVDLFDFSPNTHCLAEFVLNRCIVSKKDLSNGKENVPVPCVNYYDHSLPEFYSYNTERTPTAGVPLNLDPDFLCGCDCEDDCQDKSKCACWQLTLEGARTIQMEGDVGYVYKRLPKPLPTGIYECNSRCKCKHTCLNRVAQHPLQLKLQVFKTLNKGWGIRALNDVPEGSFLCVYAGNLLTDATATLDGLNEGDEFLAELDYIEVVEQMKEGFEEDIPEDAKEKDKEELCESSSEEESSEEEKKSKGEDDDDDVDFSPGYIGPGLTDFTKRLRKRDKKNARDKMARDKDAKQENKEDDKNQKSKDRSEKNDDCITISDDESREPSCFTAAAGMRANEFVSKYKSVRTLYGEDEACYIMDAKVQGNIGRYLNHSCTPNVFVQNVFVDTHDPRFPWVAFFALSHVRAGTELTWNYNYDVGSVPGKVLYCLCGAPNCKGRLL